MNIEDFKQMVTYVKNWKAWLEQANVSTEDEKMGKKELVEQMNRAIDNWEKQSAIMTKEE